MRPKPVVGIADDEVIDTLCRIQLETVPEDRAAARFGYKGYVVNEYSPTTRSVAPTYLRRGPLKNDGSQLRGRALARYTRNST